MRQSEYEARLAGELKILRDSPGFGALVTILMEWQRLVFQEFLKAEGEEELRQASTLGKVLQDVLILIDNRIEAGEAWTKRQIEESRAEAERESEEVRFHEQHKRREPSFL